MIRPFTALCMLLAGASGLYLYQAKHRSQLLERQIESVVHEADAMREQIGVLHAEWTLLNDPERLAQFADRFLPDLKTTQPGQFAALADIGKRLPAIRLPGAARGTTDTDTPDTPEAAAPPAAPPAAAPTPAPAQAPIATAPPSAPPPPVIASGPAVERAGKQPIPLRTAAKPAEPAEPAKPAHRAARETAETARPVINLAPPRQAAAPPVPPVTAPVQTASLLGPRPALPATQHPAASLVHAPAEAPATPPAVHAQAPAPPPAAPPVIHALATAPAARPAPIRTAARAVTQTAAPVAPAFQAAPAPAAPAPAATVSALGMAHSYGTPN